MTFDLYISGKVFKPLGRDISTSCGQKLRDWPTLIIMLSCIAFTPASFDSLGAPPPPPIITWL